MTQYLIIVDQIKDWRAGFPEVPVMTAKEYLALQNHQKTKDLRVINLCRTYRYLSMGYFCSLLAEPRRHKVIPSVQTLVDLSSKTIYGLNIEDLHESVQKNMKNYSIKDGDSFELPIFFGRCEAVELQDLGRQIFDLFRCPLLKVEFRHSGKWQINTVKAMHLHDGIIEAHNAFFIETLTDYIDKPWRNIRQKSQAKYDLAILFNPHNKLAPSNPKALQKFIKAGKRLNVSVELIEKKDYSRLAEYDGLFIRETTNLDHYTYRFAKKAQNEGIPVIDDPESILKCTNKVYLAELLIAHHIPAPKTKILYKAGVESLQNEIHFPVVLKIPDGAFSKGVVRACNAEEFKMQTGLLFKESDLILAQEFLFTEFDWRIGILNNQPLFVCQYFMSESHWQIIHHEASGRFTEGRFKNWKIEDAPQCVIDLALSLAQLIGNGLYGVDIKQRGEEVYAIEINDNPNIDAGVEDQILGDALYERVIGEFLRRMNA